MADAEKWRTLAQVLAVTVPIGALIGFSLGWLIGGEASSMAAGAVIGLLVSAGMVSFDVSWAVGLIPRGWREAPFLVVILTRTLVWSRGIQDSIELFAMSHLVDRPATG